MYSVLIVDDEQPVLDSITFILQKHRPQLQIAGTAMSGREAIRKAAETKPDIILIDVKMPGIDGLEALREIKRKMPYVTPILTTAYERFDIAQTAFELGVQDYILKPFSKDKLIAAIDAAVKSLDRRSDGQGESLKQIELLHSLGTSIERLLFKAIQLNEDLQDFFPYLQAALSLQVGRGCIGILRLDSAGTAGHGPSEVSDMGQKIISQLKYKFICMGALIGDEVLFLFPEHQQDHRLPARRHFEKIFRQIEGGDSKINGSFEVGECVDFPSLSKSYYQARLKLSEESERSTDAHDFFSTLQQRRSQFEEAVISGEERKALKIAEKTLLETEDLESAKTALLDLGLYVEHLHGLSTAGLQIFSRVSSIEELLPACGEWIEQLSALSASKHKDDLPPVLQRALQYIDQHYSHPLQLSDAADHVNVSPSYLSSLFSKHLRRSFIDHLTDIRMEKAKRLLCEQNQSIKSISRMVGYQDPNYFSRLFKKYTGQAPSEYS